MLKSCQLWLNVAVDLFRFLVLSLRSESSLAAENLFLRKQLGFYQERNIRPRRTSPPAQATLILLSRWFDWRSALTVVTPRTFIGWQRRRFRLFWRAKCQAGRPRIPPDLQRLIRTIAHDNPSWGQERIANELLVELGLRVSPRTIRKYLPEWAGAPRGNRRRDQRWSTFLKNHAAAIIACDFFVVATASFRIFYVLVVMDMLHAESFTSTSLPIPLRSGPSNNYVRPFLQTTRTALSCMTTTRSSLPVSMLR